jgi:negative regulator of flagellin synthesis FlgM
MTVGRIDSINPIAVNRKVDSQNRVDSKAGEGDSVNISREAQEKAEYMKAFKFASAAPAEPAVRSDLVADIKAKINDPAYINDKLLSATADNVLAWLGM